MDKRRTTMKKILLNASLIIAVSILAGCSSSKFNTEQVKTPNYQQNEKYKLYADLKKNDSGWIFENIRINPRSKAPTVTLGSYGLKNPSTLSGNYENKCSRQLWFNAAPCSDNEFVEQYVNYRTLFTPVAAVVVPYLWIPFGLPVGFGQGFDWDVYRDVVETAKQNGDYDNKFPTIYNNYVELRHSINQNERNYSNTVFQNLYSGYEKELNSDVNSKLEVVITDKSGLAETQIKNADLFRQYVKTEVRLKMGVKTPQPYLDENDALSELAYSSNLENFSSKLSEAQTQLSKMKQDNRQRTANNKQLFKVVEDNLPKNSAIVSFKTDHKLYDRFPDYNIKVNLPDTTTITSGKMPNSFKVPMTITSRSFKGILPRSYNNQNTDMSITLDGSQITVVNNTNKYISIDALSLYHETKILTHKKSDELPPRSVKNFWLSDFNLESLSSDYHSLTKSKAKKINVNFGFALKYRITEDNKPKTLYNSNSYNLYDLI